MSLNKAKHGKIENVAGSAWTVVYLTVLSMNSLNQTEPATFSILQFWTFFRDSYFLYFIEPVHGYRHGTGKSYPQHRL
jgi:hypothetical protein